jgi:hypothetical protein
VAGIGGTVCAPARKQEAVRTARIRSCIDVSVFYRDPPVQDKVFRFS